jgi:hypothetical protein
VLGILTSLVFNFFQRWTEGRSTRPNGREVMAISLALTVLLLSVAFLIFSSNTPKAGFLGRADRSEGDHSGNNSCGLDGERTRGPHCGVMALRSKNRAALRLGYRTGFLIFHQAKSSDVPDMAPS